MATPGNNSQGLSETETRRKLLEKSAALKNKTALLKVQMEATAKACNELLHPDKKENKPDHLPASSARTFSLAKDFRAPSRVVRTDQMYRTPYTGKPA